MADEQRSEEVQPSAAQLKTLAFQTIADELSQLAYERAQLRAVADS
jgi:hypothetical protein